MVGMTDNTMCLTLHMREGTDAAITVDEATKSITMGIKVAGSFQSIVAIPADLAAPYVNLFLHKTDLYRARAYLVEFDEQGGVPPPGGMRPGWAMSVVCQALWHSALASTMKCFQHSESRTEKLDPDRIFGTDTTQPVRAAFDLLKALRNKHVLHDENDWMQTTPYAIVGDAGNNQPTVGDIDWIVMEGTDTAHIGQLRTVVDAACDWIMQEIDTRTEAIRADLQARGYDALMAMPPPPVGNTPHAGSIRKRRH